MTSTCCDTTLPCRKSKPPPGAYEVIVQNFDQRGTMDAPFTVSITENGETELFEKTMPHNPEDAWGNELGCQTVSIKKMRY